MDIQSELIKMQDEGYKGFHAKLMPTIKPDTIIGIRVPVLREFAKKIKDTDEAKEFITKLPHKYYEENNLHAFLICGLNDFEECIKGMDKFLPYVDNWATCDGIRPKCFKKNTDKLLSHIYRWLKSEHTYTKRFAIEMLMTYYLDDEFDEKYLEDVSKIVSDEYYINMMIAWYFATALAKQYQKTIPYIEQKRLPKWVHNKTIQKAIESYRITDEQKAYLRKMKIK